MKKVTKAQANAVIKTGAVDLPVDSGKPKAGGVVGFDAVKLQAEQVYNDCITLGNDIAQLEFSKADKLRSIVAKIASLTADAHIAYRNMLTDDLNQMKKDAKEFGVDVRQLRGYALGSYIVMVSNWKTISKAFSNGMVYVESEDWQTTLNRAQEMTKATADSGKTGPKAGRKVKIELDVVAKALELVKAMTDEERAEFVEKMQEIANTEEAPL